MKTIGFIDYYLDEWHANNYPAWIRGAGRGFEVTRAWAAVDKPGGLTTEAWCRKYGVARATSMEEVVDNCDGIVVLSPDNPEQHEHLASLPLRSGKPVYVDKTFAPTLASAQRMFKLAEEHSTPLCSSSALRFAPELVSWLRTNGVSQRDVRCVAARGPGVFENYSIHQIEMIVTAIGVGAKRAIAPTATKGGEADESLAHVCYEYADGRSSSLRHFPWANFSLAVQCADGKTGAALEAAEDFWPGFVQALLNFFDARASAIPKAETLETIRMHEAGALALASPGQWVDCP